MTPEQVVTEMARTIPVMMEEARSAMDRAVELTAERMSELAPKGSTGELARDLTRSVRATKDGLSGLVRPRKFYAGFVDQGTGQGKTARNKAGGAYSSTGRHPLSRAEELADPFGVLTASGWGSRSGGPLAVHVRDGILFRQHVRGQRARHFVERTRDATVDEVETLLAGGAERATARLFP